MMQSLGPTVHGMFWYRGWLWFTESGAIFKARGVNGDGVADEEQTVIPNGQLLKGGHWWRPILIHQGRPYGELVYVSFLTKDGKVLGRPVDVVVAPDGSLLISDDESGRVYRLSYRGGRSGNSR